MRIPIAVKYSLMIMFTILTTSALLSWYFLGYMKEELQSEMYKRGGAVARNMAYTVAPLLLSKDDAKIGAALASAIKEPDVESMSVLDHDFKTVADARPEALGKPFYDPVLDIRNVSSSVHAVDEENDQLVFARVAKFSGVQVGLVVVRVGRGALRIAIKSATRRVLLITCIIAGLVIVIGFFTLSRTIKPLSMVLDGTRRISRGEFSTRLEIKSNDEIGELARAFNDMAARTELFFRYVDKSIAERLAQDESLARPGGSMRQVSVLFGDMRDFTAMSNQRSPSDVVWILNTYFDLFFEVVHQFGGVVDKTMGDAIMAFFEPSRANAIDNSHRATLAAVCMKSAVWILNRVIDEAKRSGVDVVLEPRNFGFSVATGRLIVGNIGSDRKMDYTVCGPAVNLASRLQQETKNGEIVLDKFTAMDVEELVEIGELHQVQPKGFLPLQKVTPYNVIRVKEVKLPQLRTIMRRLFSKSFFRLHMSRAVSEPMSDEQVQHLVQFVARLIDGDPKDFLSGDLVKGDC
jgi:class 3 adenylate cyclase